MSSVYDRLEQMSKRFEEIEAALADTSRPFDQERYMTLARERAKLVEPVEAYRAYTRLLADIAANDALLADGSDPEMHALAEEEAQALARAAQRARRASARADDSDRSERRQRRLHRDSRRSGRRRSRHLRRRFAAHVSALRRRSRHARRAGLGERKRSRRLQRSRHLGQGRRAVSLFQIRKRRPSRATRPGDGSARPRPHQHRDGRRASGSRETSTSRSARTTSRSTRSKPPAPAANTSTRPSRRSASRTSRLGTIVACSEERSQLQNNDRAMQMLRAVIYDRKQREAQEAVGNLRRCKSVPAIAARRSAPTTSRKTASPITASTRISETSTRFSTATWIGSSASCKRTKKQSSWRAPPSRDRCLGARRRHHAFAFRASRRAGSGIGTHRCAADARQSPGRRSRLDARARR